MGLTKLQRLYHITSHGPAQLRVKIFSVFCYIFCQAGKPTLDAVNYHGSPEDILTQTPGGTGSQVCNGLWLQELPGAGSRSDKQVYM